MYRAEPTSRPGTILFFTAVAYVQITTQKVQLFSHKAVLSFEKKALMTVFFRDQIVNREPDQCPNDPVYSPPGCVELHFLRDLRKRSDSVKKKGH